MQTPSCSSSDILTGRCLLDSQMPVYRATREPMSALGHKQISRHVRVMSVILLKADIHQRGLHVGLVPKADIFHPGFGH